ncbi:MAG: (Fe-S)-binding protein [Deltaproteobacteria bacterium]|nr:(Fe-S)-binding protein [Deltaproteobacteria bacterium]
MVITQEQIDYCMECGVCTGSCPISRMMSNFSPRQMIKRTLMDRDEAVVHCRELWSCLTCARCSVRCPAAIDFPEFVRRHREGARKEGNVPQLAHHGTLQAIAALQTRNVKQQRTAWATDAGRIAASGDIFFFVGCAPYFEAVLKPGAGAEEVPRSVLKLLNRLGIEPVVSNDERCCGHDALWSGDEETFRRLNRWNLEVIRGSGARTVLFSCPEGFTVFKHYLPKFFGDLPFEVLHVTEFLARELPGAGVTFKPFGESGNGGVTYQDPCRLGRQAGIFDPPRQLIAMVPGIAFVEMARNRENSACCGTTAWMECSSCSKALQVERLQEAQDAGAGTIITACPKCRIHLTCAEQNTEYSLSIKDLYAFLLQQMA